jgi:metal-responsive CopG/Arc/MetJ family transcriptional regulator
MKTIQMTLDDQLLKQIDEIIKDLKISRSAYIRDSIRHYLKQTDIKQMEKQHRDGYQKFPVKKGEFDVWEDEQIWS